MHPDQMRNVDFLLAQGGGGGSGASRMPLTQGRYTPTPTQQAAGGSSSLLGSAIATGTAFAGPAAFRRIRSGLGGLQDRVQNAIINPSQIRQDMHDRMVGDGREDQLGRIRARMERNAVRPDDVDNHNDAVDDIGNILGDHPVEPVVPDVPDANLPIANIADAPEPIRLATARLSTPETGVATRGDIISARPDASDVQPDPLVDRVGTSAPKGVANSVPRGISTPIDERAEALARLDSSMARNAVSRDATRVLRLGIRRAPIRTVDGQTVHRAGDFARRPASRATEMNSEEFGNYLRSEVSNQGGIFRPAPNPGVRGTMNPRLGEGPVEGEGLLGAEAGAGEAAGEAAGEGLLGAGGLEAGEAAGAGLLGGAEVGAAIGGAEIGADVLGGVALALLPLGI